MTRPTLILLVSLLIFSCKKEKEQVDNKTDDLSITEKIANAHGYDKWPLVETFQFTFGVAIEDPNSGRSWIWNPKSNDITLTTTTDSISYNRNSMDSLAIQADRAFINDKFWALIPFQLVWDEGTTISPVEESISPVKQDTLSKISIVYGNEGGYTPGDAYDIYFDKDYIIREWSFRKGNSEEPSLSNTFESYSDYNGLKVAQDHIFAGSGRNLLIRNVKVALAK